MTRDEIVAILADRFAKNELFTTPEVSDLRTGGGSVLNDDVEANKLLVAFVENDNCKFGGILIDGIKDWMVTQALATVEAALDPDDTLTLTEIEKIL